MPVARSIGQLVAEGTDTLAESGEDGHRLDDRLHAIVGVPAVIGAGGAERVVEISLNSTEQKAFEKSVAAVNGLIDACKKIAPKLA